MRVEALRFLVCPSCADALALRAREGTDGEITTGGLVCPRCRASFPIVRGVPRFVSSLGDREQIAESFGFQWAVRVRGGFEAATLYGLSEDDEREAFFRALDLAPADLEGRTILDAGCGDGFLLRVLTKFPVRLVGIDINTSIDRTWEACKGFDNVSVIAADLLQPPFRAGSFDVVWSEGVIVCMPDPRAAFASLARLVRPGGKLYVWVYSSERLSVYQRVRDLLVASYRLPKPILFRLSYLLAVPIYLAAKPYAAWRGRRGVAVDPKPSVRSVAFGLFDNLAPRYQSRHSIDEVRGWFEEFGFSNLKRSGAIGMSGTRVA